MRALTVILSLLAGPVVAHELWLEPTQFQVPDEGMLIADFVNGQQFSGIKLAYLAPRIVSYRVVNGDQSADIVLRNGDTPGLQWPALGSGLNVVAYQSAVATVDYAEWAKFEKFALHKSLPVTHADHIAKGFPDADFKEAYTRFSKTLIAVGDGAGADLRTGLETEIVALTNPYTDDLSAGMMVQLYYGDAVRADEQIEIFDRAPDQTVAITTVRTDTAGFATIPVTAGHVYMLDAVVLRAPSAELAAETGAIYETLWANLTFQVPE